MVTAFPVSEWPRSGRVIPRQLKVKGMFGVNNRTESWSRNSKLTPVSPTVCVGWGRLSDTFRVIVGYTFHFPAEQSAMAFGRVQTMMMMMAMLMVNNSTMVLLARQRASCCGSLINRFVNGIKSFSPAGSMVGRVQCVWQRQLVGRWDLKCAFRHRFCSVCVN